MDWTDGNGNFQGGDCPPGWHAPTTAELTAYATIRLTNARSNQGNAVRQDCTTYITTTPFQSIALGSSNSYDCRDIDQINLLTRITLVNANPTTTQPVWCSNGTVYTYTQHNQSQLMQVLEDMNTFIMTNQSTCGTIIGQINAVPVPDTISADSITATVAQIQAINWS
jgi:hypothetical protein